MTKVFYEGEEHMLLSFLQTKNYSKRILLCDANTHGFCVPVLKKMFPFFKNAATLVIPQGEEHKALDTCSFVWTHLEEMQLDRNALLVNLGGGVVSDLGGFAASVFKRGIDFINIPTSLLSMVDACYGGKTGIDFNGIKNCIGTFQHPQAIYINPLFLKTLNERILISGIAEIVKHGLISSEEWFEELARMEVSGFKSIETIKKSLQTKIEFVKQDERDLGIRQALNFGHTMGHAIESYSLQTAKPLLHGEAILLGMHFELKLSEQLLGLEKHVLQRYTNFLKQIFPTLSLHISFEVIRPFLLQDKKNVEGIRMSLLKHSGICQTQVLVSEEQIRDLF